MSVCMYHQVSKNVVLTVTVFRNFQEDYVAHHTLHAQHGNGIHVSI